MLDLAGKITDMLTHLDKWASLRSFLIEGQHIDVCSIAYEYSIRESLLDTETLLLCLYIVKEHAKGQKPHSAGSLAQKLCGAMPKEDSSKETKELHRNYVRKTQAKLTSRLCKIAPYKIIKFEKEKREGDAQERYYIEPTSVLLNFLENEFFKPTKDR